MIAVSCYHPMKIFDVTSVEGLTANGKRSFKYVPYTIDHLEYNKNTANYLLSQDKFISSYADKIIYENMTVPCGQCVGCRIDYSRQWANRMLCELQYHSSSYFITLTYDDDHVPLSYYGDPETGEALPSLTLVKKDFQLFMKRLRYFTGQELRYYACGEYGSNTLRPHYHAIIFGLVLDDLDPLFKSDQGNQTYRSAMIEKCWTKGFSMVASVTWASCAYVARYVTKKLSGKAAEFYDLHNLEPEFSLMSLKPAIGREYYEQHRDHIYEFDSISVSTEKGGKTFPPPKYFDRLYEIEYPDEMEKIKEIRRSMAEHGIQDKLKHTDLSYLELLEVEENAFKSRIKSLQRDL